MDNVQLILISFLNQTRIEKVCHELASSTTPIQDIAFSSGFETLSHFNRIFKRLKNCSPRDYRNLYQKNQINCPTRSSIFEINTTFIAVFLSDSLLNFDT